MFTYLNTLISFKNLLIFTMLTMSGLLLINKAHPAPTGSDIIIHLISLAILAFPLALTSRFGLIFIIIIASVYGRIIGFQQPFLTAALIYWFGLWILST